MPFVSKAEALLIIPGVLLILAFPLLMGIPVIGYVAETSVLFFTMFLAYRKREWLLAAATLGSLALSISLHGPQMLVMTLWAKAVLPGTVFGAMLAGGATASRSFMITVFVIAAVTLTLFISERHVILGALNSVASWVESGKLFSADKDKELAGWVISTISILKRLMPALMVLAVITQLLLAWIVLLIVIRSLGIYMPKVLSFYYWKMPDYYAFVTGVVILGRLAGTETMKLIADNILIFIGIFYAAFGFSLFEYYLKKIRLSLFLRILFYIGLVFLQLPGLMLAALAGLFDSYFDFRKVRARILG